MTSPADIPAPTPTRQPSGDTAKIAARVRGLNVTQLEGNFVWGLQTPDSMTVEFSDIAAGGTRRNERVFVAVNFAARGIHGGIVESPSTREDSVFLVHATFLAQYFLQPGEDFSDDDLQIFSQVNGPFSVYPYWREFLATALTRMGVPQIIPPQLLGGRFVAQPLPGNSLQLIAERISALNLPDAPTVETRPASADPSSR